EAADPAWAGCRHHGQGKATPAATGADSGDRRNAGIAARHEDRRRRTAVVGRAGAGAPWRGSHSGAFVAGALSGYGTMGACATGALVAAWVFGEKLADFACSLSLAPYDDKALMQ